MLGNLPLRFRSLFLVGLSLVLLASITFSIFALKHPQIFKSKASEDGSVEIISSEGEKVDSTVNTTQIKLQIIAPDWSQSQSFKFDLVTKVYAQEEGGQSDEDSIPEPTPDQDIPETTQTVRISLNSESIQKDSNCLDSFDVQSRCLEMLFSELLTRGSRVDWFLPEQEGEYTIYIGFISSRGNFKSTSKSITLYRQVTQPDNPIKQVSEAVDDLKDSLTTSDIVTNQSTNTPQYSCDCIDFDNICNSACSEYGTVGNFCTQQSSCTTRVEPGLPQFASEGKDPQQLYNNSGVSLEDYQKILKDLQVVYGDKVIGWVWQDLGIGERRPNPVYSDTQSFPTGIPSISQDQAREIGIFTIGAATGASKLLLAPGYALVHFLTHPDAGGETFLTVSQLKETGINIEVSEQTNPETGETEIVIGPDINQILAQANSLGLALQLFPDPDPQTQEVRFVVLPPINPTTLEQIPTLLVDTFLGEVGGRVIGKAIHFTAGKVFKRSTQSAAKEVTPKITPEIRGQLDRSPIVSTPLSPTSGQIRNIINAQGELRTLGSLPEGSFYVIEEAEVAVLKDTLKNRLGLDVDSLGIKISWYLDDMPSFVGFEAGNEISNFAVSADRAIELATQYTKSAGENRTFASTQEAQAYLKSLAPQAFIHEIGHAIYQRLPGEVVESWIEYIKGNSSTLLRAKVVEVQAGKRVLDDIPGIADEAFADFFVEKVTGKTSRLGKQEEASKLASQMVSDYTGSAISKIDPRGEAGFELISSRTVISSDVESELTASDLSTVSDELRKKILGQRRVEVQATIRAKYRLPPRDMRFEDTTEYIRRLREIAEENGVDIRHGYEFQQFFDETPDAGAVFMPKYNAAVVPLSEDLIKLAGYLEHEIIHGLQYKFYPRLTLRMMEYEAYVAGGNTRVLVSDPSIFGLMVNMSLSVDESLKKKEANNALYEAKDLVDYLLNTR